MQAATTAKEEVAAAKGKKAKSGAARTSKEERQHSDADSIGNIMDDHAANHAFGEEKTVEQGPKAAKKKRNKKDRGDKKRSLRRVEDSDADADAIVPFATENDA